MSSILPLLFILSILSLCYSFSSLSSISVFSISLPLSFSLSPRVLSPLSHLSLSPPSSFLPLIYLSFSLSLSRPLSLFLSPFLSSICLCLSLRSSLLSLSLSTVFSPMSLSTVLSFCRASSLSISYLYSTSSLSLSRPLSLSYLSHSPLSSSLSPLLFLSFPLYLSPPDSSHILSRLFISLSLRPISLYLLSLLFFYVSLSPNYPCPFPISPSSLLLSLSLTFPEHVGQLASPAILSSSFFIACTDSRAVSRRQKFIVRERNDRERKQQLRKLGMTKHSQTHPNFFKILYSLLETSTVIT